MLWYFTLKFQYFQHSRNYMLHNNLNVWKNSEVNLKIHKGRHRSPKSSSESTAWHLQGVDPGHSWVILPPKFENVPLSLELSVQPAAWGDWQLEMQLVQSKLMCWECNHLGLWKCSVKKQQWYLINILCWLPIEMITFCMLIKINFT